MNNELEIFKNTEFGQIRTVTIDNEPWFVGKDIAESLGYKKARNAISTHVDIDDKKDAPIQGDLGGTQSMTVINESGLYSLILSSKLESAKRFKHWVTTDVLPTIRKHGAYMTEQTLEQALASPDFLIQLATQLKEEQTARKLAEEAKHQAELIIEEQQPKVDLALERIHKKGCYSITDVTRSLKLKRGQITKWAKENKFIHKTLAEVNKAGLDYFKVYSTDYIHNQIGITDLGLSKIKTDIETIKVF